MKMVSARQYKNDLSDIVGIVGEHQHNNNPLTLERIDRAVCDLYSSWSVIESDTKQLLERVLALPDAFAVYQEYRNAELEAKDLLAAFEKKYPKVLQESNLKDILQQARKKKQEETLEPWEQAKRKEKACLLLPQ